VPVAASGRTFLLGVTGQDGHATNFSVVAKTGRAVQLLQDRTPLQAELKPGEVSGFKVFVPANAISPVLSVAVVSGRISLSSTTAGANTTATTTQAGIVPLVPGQVNVIVASAEAYAASAGRLAVFVLLPIMANDATIVLADGQPTVMVLQAGQTELFNFAVPPGTTLTVSSVQIDPRPSATLDLTAAMQSSVVQSTATAGDVATAFVLGSQLDGCVNGLCSISIALTSSESANVSVTAASAGATAQLPLGVPIGGMGVSRDDTSQYVVVLDPVDDADDDLTLDLQLCLGHAALYTSKDSAPSISFSDDATTIPAPLHVTAFDLAGRARMFAAVAVGERGAKFQLEARKSSATARNVVLRESEGALHLTYSSSSGMRVRFPRPRGHSGSASYTYELYFAPDGGDSTTTLAYWCGVRERGTLIPASHIEDDQEDGPMAALVLKVAERDGSICATGGQACFVQRQSYVLTVVARHDVGFEQRLVFTPVVWVAGSNAADSGGGGMSGFAVFVRFQPSEVGEEAQRHSEDCPLTILCV